MILELNVKNIALMPALSLELGAGLSVLTGETGAGKSILLGALSLLLGERASADSIRSDCETATVEAMFQVSGLPQITQLLDAQGLPPCEDDTLILKRVLSRAGKGKCYVNGGFTTLTVLGKIGEELVDLHGQHEHQSLLHRSQQRDLLDRWAGLLPVREKVNQAYTMLRASREARERMALDEAERTRRLDLLNFQVDEITAADIRPGEQNALQEERSKLAHAEKLLTSVHNVLDVLHRREETAARDGLSESAETLADLARFDDNMGALADDLRSAEALTGEVVNRLIDFADSFEADPARLEQVEERLDQLQKLARKYGENEAAILAFCDQAAKERDQLVRQDDTLEELARAEVKLSAELSVQAQKLSEARQSAAAKLDQQLSTELKKLGFAQAKFKINVAPREDETGWVRWEEKRFHCGPNGADDIEFQISPNPGESLKPVAKTASGGELSRIMLAIKVIAAAAAQVPTMIFDEVDAGIGGATAEAVGRSLQTLSRQRQVMVITHLPQLARFADRHFLVSKQVTQGRTQTTVDTLQGETRVREVARLMAGEQITDTALQHAQELIEKK